MHGEKYELFCDWILFLVESKTKQKGGQILIFLLRAISSSWAYGSFHYLKLRKLYSGIFQVTDAVFNKHCLDSVWLLKVLFYMS